MYVYLSDITCVPDAVDRQGGKGEEVGLIVVGQLESAVADLINKHLSARETGLLAVVAIDNDTGFLILNVEARHRRVMGDLLADDARTVVPVAQKLFTEDGVEGLLFPFTLGNAAGERAVE